MEKNKIQLKIEKLEEKRQKRVDEVWSTLTEQDKLYMENIEFLIYNLFLKIKK